MVFHVPKSTNVMKDSITVTRTHHAPTPLAVSFVLVTMVTEEMASIATTSMNVLPALTFAMWMPNVQILLAVTLVFVTLGTTVTVLHVPISMNVPQIT
jgi:hypothetical protein